MAATSTKVKQTLAPADTAVDAAQTHETQAGANTSAAQEPALVADPTTPSQPESPQADEAEILKNIRAYLKLIELRKQLNAHQRVSLVTGLLGSIAKTGRNEFFKYNYIEWGAVLAHLRRLLSDYGLVPEFDPATLDSVKIEKAERDGTKIGERVRYRATFKLVNADNPDDCVVYPNFPCLSEAFDDKVDQKALTLGMKSWLMKAFMVTDQSEPDPDGEEGAGNNARYSRPAQSSGTQQPIPFNGGRNGGGEAGGTGSISQKQIGFIFGRSKAHGWTPEQVKQLVKLKFGIDSLDKLKSADVDKLVGMMAAGKPETLLSQPSMQTPPPAAPPTNKPQRPTAPPAANTADPWPESEAEMDGLIPESELDDEPMPPNLWPDLTSNEFNQEIINVSGGMTLAEAAKAMGYSGVNPLYTATANKYAEYRDLNTRQGEKLSMVVEMVRAYFKANPGKVGKY